MHTLHKEKGARLRTEILAEKSVRQFIQTHAETLDSSFREVEMSDIMRSRLQESDYIFSGIKTFHELNEAFPALTDSDGNRKPFGKFLEDVRTINETYNRYYLRAEYNFAHASAGMAARWEQIERDGDDYDLQYRTAGDDKVRASHAALDGVTLPPSDPFWKIYYPPNGWNCRCTAVQVRKDKYPRTPSDEAMLRGAEATANDKRGLFRFNSGLERKTFPDYNPYTIQQCRQIRFGLEEESRKTVQKWIRENRKLYDRLSKDKKYMDVKFDPQTGALKATHVGHNEGNDIGFVFEKKLVDMLYSTGHSIILCDEQKKDNNGNKLTSLDMILDGIRMDIKSITKDKIFYGAAISGKNNQIARYNSRTDVREPADTVCLYFDDPTMFSPEKITKGYNYMKSKTNREIFVKHILCAVNSTKGLELKLFDFP